MENKERTVIEHLEDIEKKIPDFSKIKTQKPQTLTDKVGKPFEEFLNEATIYGYEQDERKFKKEIKEKMKKPVIGAILLFCTLVATIVFYVINQGNEWLLILSSSLSLLYLLFYLCILFKTKPLQPMKSFWNYERTDFYITQKDGKSYLEDEKNKTALFHIIKTYSILCYLANYALAFIYFISNLLSKHENEWSFWLMSVIGLIIAVLGALVLSSGLGRPYYFFNYRMDTEDGYLAIPDYEYHKKEKE